MTRLLALLALLLTGCATAPPAQPLRAQHPNGYLSSLTHTGSAEPVFYGGDRVWIDTRHPYEALAIGDWVVAWPVGYPGPIGPHAVVATEGPLYRTQGINSRWPDQWLLSPTNYIGRVKWGIRGGVVIHTPQ